VVAVSLRGTAAEHERSGKGELRHALYQLHQARKEKSCSMRVTHAVAAIEHAAEYEHESRWVSTKERIRAIGIRQKIRRAAVKLIGGCAR
jgi:hypothetical protein